MKRVILFTVFLGCVSLANAGFVENDWPNHDWEYWTEGDFGYETLDTDEGFKVTGGRGEQIMLSSNSIAVIEDTDTTGIHRIVTGNDSFLYLSGGTIDRIISDQLARQYHPESPPIDPEHIFITCRSYDDTVVDENGVVTLTGVWEDWSTFNILLFSEYQSFSALDNIAFEIVPEPVSLVLLGFGGLFLRRRRPC